MVHRQNRGMLKILLLCTYLSVCVRVCMYAQVCAFNIALRWTCRLHGSNLDSSTDSLYNVGRLLDVSLSLTILCASLGSCED